MQIFAVTLNFSPKKLKSAAFQCCQDQERKVKEESCLDFCWLRANVGRNSLSEASWVTVAELSFSHLTLDQLEVAESRVREESGGILSLLPVVLIIEIKVSQQWQVRFPSYWSGSNEPPWRRWLLSKSQGGTNMISDALRKALVMLTKKKWVFTTLSTLTLK